MAFAKIPPIADQSVSHLPKGPTRMRDRQNTLLWMKDLIEHMNRCQEQLQWAADGRTETFLTEALMGDLTECRRLCEQLRSTRRQEPCFSR
jgi:hypothetical protein